MPFIDDAPGRLYYRHWTTNESPRAALIFLHGFGEHSGLYHRYAAELGAHGVELWAIDHRGHGLSDGERGIVGSYDSVVADARSLTALALERSPGLPLVIGGHSLGSLGALLAALDEPDRYVAAVISGAPLSPLPWLAEAAGSVSEEPFSLELDALSSDPFYRDELANDPLAFTEADVVGVLGALFTPAWQRLDAQAGDIRLPVLAVHGVNDPIAPLSGVTGWQSRISDFRIEVIDDAAHDVLNEAAHLRVADLIGGFITDHAHARTAA